MSATSAPAAAASAAPKVTVATLAKMRASGERITMISCYDATSAAVVDSVGCEIILVGDSLGMLVQGHDSTLPVTLEHAKYHVACVARGSKRVLVLGDMPFGTYQVSPEKAYENAAELMAAGSHMVKIEGGVEMVDTVRFLTSRGIPVCGHIGLTPQYVNALGGFKVQGKDDAAARALVDAARRLEQAGMSMLVIEAVPASLGKEITQALSIPTIGIGAGPDCSGQILLFHDLTDMFPGRKAKFVKNFMTGAGSVQAACAAFVKEVKAGTFPGPEHCY